MLGFITKAIVGLAAVTGMTVLWGVVFPVALMVIILYALKLVPMTGRHKPDGMSGRRDKP